MKKINHVFAVVLAGGDGTRLWPKSRNEAPKQFLRITDNRTMLQVTVSRLTKLVPLNQIIVVTNKKYEQEVRNQLPEIQLENIIAEPEKKDTALAMLVGACFAKAKDPQAIVINAASDHVVSDENEFARVMKAAINTCIQDDYLVTVGITPTFPSTGLGYIKTAEDIKKLAPGLSLFKVSSFTEKPNQATAQAFISTGRYFWNANMYVWTADSIIKAFKQHMPIMYEATENLSKLNPNEFKQALVKIYRDAEKISIDYAISEKATNLVLIPGDFGWNDVGNWQIVYDLSTKDLAGNVIISDQGQADTLAINAHHNLVHTNGRLIAMIGVDNLVIIDTPDILMITPKSKSQEVKKLVQRLKEENKAEYL